MSRKNKVVYSNIQPNTKEAGIWVNTDDGNIKIEKDGKWIDDGGSSSGESSAIEYWSMDWDMYNSLESSLKQTVLRSAILGSSELSKITMNGTVEIKNSGAVLFMDMFSNGSMPYSIMAISYNKMVNITTDGDKQLSFEEVLLENEAQVEGITDCFSRITKEEFYSLS